MRVSGKDVKFSSADLAVMKAKQKEEEEDLPLADSVADYD